MASSAPTPSVSPIMGVARVLGFWAFAIAILVGCSFLKPLVPAAFGPLLWGLTSSALVLALIAVCGRRDRRSWRQSGIRVDSVAGAELLGGLLLGLATYAASLVCTSLIIGPIRLNAGSPAALAALPLVFAGIVALGLMEELAFRTYAFWTATTALGPRGGQVLVAVAFTLLHLVYGWSWPTLALGVLPSAVLFGAAAYASGGVALPLGVHVGMNFGRWLTGEVDQQGIWRLDLGAADSARLETWAPMIGAIVPILVSLGLWWWSSRRPAGLAAA